MVELHRGCERDSFWACLGRAVISCLEKWIICQNGSVQPLIFEFIHFLIYDSILEKE